MHRFRTLAICLLAAAAALADDASKTEATEEGARTVKKALNRAFRGRLVKIKKKRVTLYYDFEDERQLEDFEEARPPRLLDAGRNRVSIVAGRLVLEGSSGLRHKMEGKGELRANFFVRVGQQRNVGTVFTEPILSDFYVLLNLFDERFYEDGGLILAACGLHEDEGADVDMSLVNWRDIFRSSAKKVARPGQDVEVEVAKDGWKEYCRVGDIEGKGSSKGKCRWMPVYQFGFWVHESRASFDDLTISVELTDEFLELNDLKAEIDLDWEEVPEEGPLEGVKRVPPRVRSQIEAYAAGGGDAQELVRIVGRTGLPEKAREVAAELLSERKDPKTVPLLIDLLYSPDRETRKLAIGVVKDIVGKRFGYSAGGSEKSRSKAIRKLNEHLAKHRRRYFG